MKTMFDTNVFGLVDLTNRVVPLMKAQGHGDIVNIDVTVIKDEFHGDTSIMVQVGDVAPHAQRLIQITQECLYMGKQMRWLVGLIETEKSTETVFDLLWPLLNKGERRLSVRRGAERHALHFLIYKADQAKLEFAILPEEIRPAAVYELLKPGQGSKHSCMPRSPTWCCWPLVCHDRRPGLCASVRGSLDSGWVWAEALMFGLV